MSNDSTPFTNYSISVMSLHHTEGFPDTPNPDWHKQSVLADKKDITKLFKEFQDETGAVISPTSFIPKDSDGIRVYFNPTDERSLFIVAETKGIADDYAEKLGLRKPYNVPKREREEMPFDPADRFRF